jgi:hypothetical protein
MPIVLFAVFGIVASVRSPLRRFIASCPLLGYIGGGSCTAFVWWRSEGDYLLCAVVFGMALVFSVLIVRRERRVMADLVRRELRLPASSPRRPAPGTD